GDDDEVDRLDHADEGALPWMREQFTGEEERDDGQDDAQSEPDAIEEESVDALAEIRRSGVLGRQPRFGSRHAESPGPNHPSLCRTVSTCALPWGPAWGGR